MFLLATGYLTILITILKISADMTCETPFRELVVIDYGNIYGI